MSPATQPTPGQRAPGGPIGVDRFCSACGSPRAAADHFCARCGQALAAAHAPVLALAGAVAAPRGVGVLASNVEPALERSPFWAPRPAETTRGRAWTHPGLTFALVCLTFGLYAVYWFFDTWREIKRHDGDEGKRPVGHALAMLVPVYGLFRLHAHMRTIAGLVRASGGVTSLSPGTAVVVGIVVNGLYSTGSPGKLGLALNLLALVLQGGLLAWAQAALNQAWHLHDPQARVRPTHPATWVALGVGAIVSLLVLIGLAR
jgi:hypothetical protein